MFQQKTSKLAVGVLGGLVVCSTILASWRGIRRGQSLPAAPDGHEVTRTFTRAEAHRQGSAESSSILFSDVGREWGLDWIHVSGMTDEKMYPTANGSGIALFDYDGDGVLDLYALTMQRFTLDSASPESDGPKNCLYRGQQGGTMQRLDVLAGLAVSGYCQGVTAGDFDNDGYPDIYLTSYGGNQFFHNLGDGTFRDQSRLSQTDSKLWGSSAACLDFNEDGALDLYVANYGKWKPEENPFCGDRSKGIRVFCRPTQLTPEVHQLFENQGDGSFREVSQEVGIARTDGRGQGVVAADLNLDGHIDLYVANDMCPNFLFLNDGNGRFTDYTLNSGAAFDGSGAALAGMGVDATDLNHDGLPELFVTNFYNEFNNLYLNLGNGFFEDISSPSRLGPDSLLAVGWGTMLTDFDNDGEPDVFVANGHVDDNMMALGNDQPFRQRSEVWRNQGNLRFERVSPIAGEYFETSHVARGAAFGDLDNDGRIDVLVLQLDEPPAVLHNDGRGLDGSRPASWIRFQLIGRTSNRDSIGSRIELSAGSVRISRQIKGGGSYLSSHDLRVLIGLGSSSQADHVSIHWPGGKQTVLDSPTLCETHKLLEPLSPPVHK